MIDLTPLDVRKKKGDFSRAMRGYEASVVDNFLDLVAERLEEVVRENATLRERTAQMAEMLNGFRQREQAMNEALVSAQQLREEVRAQAAREAELAVREAGTQAERILAEARKGAEAEVEAARRVHAARARFLRSYRTFLDRQIEEVAAEEERLREPPPAEPAAEDGW